MTFKNDKTATQLKHLEPRAHEKICVWHVKDARGAVSCSHSGLLRFAAFVPSVRHSVSVQLQVDPVGRGWFHRFNGVRDEHLPIFTVFLFVIHYSSPAHLHTDVSHLVSFAGSTAFPRTDLSRHHVVPLHVVASRGIHHCTTLSSSSSGMHNPTSHRIRTPFQAFHRFLRPA